MNPSPESISGNSPSKQRTADTMAINRRGFVNRAIGVAAGGVAASVAGLAMPHLARSAGPVELKLAHGDTPQHPGQQVALHFAQLVNERTGGDIRIRVFSGGQLGSETNTIAGLSTGIVDFIMQSTGFLAQFFPRLQVLDLPFLFANSASAEQLCDSPIGDSLLADMTTKGVYGLCWGHNGWRVLETRDRPVHAPADLKGMKVRIQPSPIFASMFRALGATPVTLDVTEVYLGLSQNTVQGTEVPFLVVVASKLYEVIKYVGLTNHVYGAAALIASKTMLDRMPAAHQKVVRDTALELKTYWRTLLAQRSDEDRKTCEQNGVKVTEVDHDAFRKAMEPVYAEFRDRIGADIVDRAMKATGA
jgi:tripartite ATP-independent transporter DctP family solute receptor